MPRRIGLASLLDSAYLLLKEVPTSMEWLVMVIVLVGMLVPKLYRGGWGAGSVGISPVSLDSSLSGR